MANDVLVIRGRGRIEGTLIQAGAHEVRWKTPSGPESGPAWSVASIELGDAPEEWWAGRGALVEARFDDAIAAFEKVAATGHRLASWAGFQAFTAHRIQCEVTGRGHGEALARGSRWLESHPDDWYRAPALFAQAILAIEGADAVAHVSPAAERWQEAKRCLDLLDDEPFGPVWRLYAQLGRARLMTRQKGVEAEVPRAFEKVRDAADKTPMGREVGQMAEAWLARWRQETGQPQALLKGIPRAVIDGQEMPAVMGADWLGSPAAPVLLNAIGEAYLALDKDAGPIAALPFHLRVTRYFSGQHAEHARALALAARGFLAGGNEQDGEALREQLRVRYPGSRWLKQLANGRHPGD